MKMPRIRRDRYRVISEAALWLALNKEVEKRRTSLKIKIGSPIFGKTRRAIIRNRHRGVLRPRLS